MITFEQVPADLYVPTVAVETDWTSGYSTLPGLGKKLLLVGYKTSAGTASTGQLVRITSTAVAEDYFGPGSHVALMARAALRQSAQLELYGVAYAEDGSAVAASGTLTFATNATGAGEAVCYIGGRRYAIGVATGDTPTALGDLLEAKVNADTLAPFTADNDAGEVTITAKNKGPTGNTIRLRASITTGIGTTLVAGAAALASGATEGDPTSALAGLQAERFHIIAINTDQSTQLGVLKTHAELMSNPVNQNWGVGIGASTGNAAAAQALSAALDSYRMQVVHLEASETPNFELVGAYAGVRAAYTTRNLPLNKVVLSGVLPACSESAWPTKSEESADIQNGVIALRPNRNGTVEIVRNVHSRVTNPAFRDAEILEISDYFDEDLITIFATRYARAALKARGPASTPNTVTPELAKAVLHERMRIWDKQLDYYDGAEIEIKAKTTHAEVNATDPTRLDIAYIFRPSFPLHHVIIKKIFTTPNA